MAAQAQTVKEQRLQVVKAEEGTLEVVNPTKGWATVEDIFAAKWTIRQMVQMSEGHVLLLLERDRPAKEMPY